jgi:hypothetical protein
VTLKRLLLVALVIWLALSVFAVVASSWGGGKHKSKTQHAKIVSVRP